MSTAIRDLHDAPAEPAVNYLNASYGIRSWLLTLDHKRIGLLYLASITVMFLVGGVAATLMRLHLVEHKVRCLNRKPTTKCSRRTGS